MSGASSLTAFKNLALYSHAFSGRTDAAVLEKDYRQVLLKDTRESENDTVWLRDEITKVLVANELLRQHVQYVPTDGQKRKVLEDARRNREAEEQRTWQQQMVRLQEQEDIRIREMKDFQRAQEEDRKHTAIVRRAVEQEQRLIADTKRRIAALKETPQPRGRFPEENYRVFVNVISGDNLPVVPGEVYVKVSFDVPLAMSVHSKSVPSTSNAVWDESLQEMHMPARAMALVVEVFHQESSHTIGKGSLDLRYPENEVLMVDLLNDSQAPAGRLFLRWFAQSPYPPPQMTTAKQGKAGGSTLDLQVIQGRDLAKTDVIGKSDPYVKMCWANDALPFYTTKVASGGNPVWNDGVTNLPVPNGIEYVSLYVWDKDRLGKDDFMGFHRLQLLPAPDGEFWVPLYPREGNREDLKLMAKTKDDLGELNIKVHFNYVPGHGGPSANAMTGPVPTRCLLTITGVDGLEMLEGNADPYVTVSVGDKEATSAHRISPLWNPTFELFAPEYETAMHFIVYDDVNVGKDSFLGQTDFDIRPESRVNRAYKLPLHPRTVSSNDSRRSSKGFGRISFSTEWVSGPAPKRRGSLGANTSSFSYPKSPGGSAPRASPPATPTFSYPGQR
eukprot:GGOE01058948.1.p1 GENE.GGOE01058948.1~~GGOE01058948.1.p1  ORF type:complete len:615 (-),score=189.65 GGOE01058948.1:323-2167(-)